MQEVEWNQIRGIQSTRECSWNKKEDLHAYLLYASLQESNEMLLWPSVSCDAIKQPTVSTNNLAVFWSQLTLFSLFPGTGSSSAEPAREKNQNCAKHLYHYYVLLVQITSTQIHDAPTGRAKGADPAVHKKWCDRELDFLIVPVLLVITVTYNLSQSPRNIIYRTVSRALFCASPSPSSKPFTAATLA